MIVVDSSVWIANLRDLDTGAVRLLRSIADPDDILVGDLILLEVLQGARSEAHAARIEAALRQFHVEPMLDDALAAQAARDDRLLRAEGATLGKTINLIIGSFCIARGHALLHDDRDFALMAKHLGLRTPGA
ncbi:PIN domain-containing protein [Methylocella sp.]|uniref:type II toxin-antitoxin system VapC family toxin n=1 Tax=Methylocella sp. TaxID=1978226 RepID=UPI003784F678